MTDFQYHFQKLPCFNCKKTTVNTDLGWLTPAMKDDVMTQLAAIIEQDNVEADLSVNVSCTIDEAHDYLLLNFYGYSIEELADQVEDEDKQEVANEVVELATDSKGIIVFEHEIALQSCTDCNIEEVSEQD
ncbi:hypothetical protein KP803_16685 [Vibrio sp. ZSDE26]|uniref:Uncharacterized protein n=1 Tax=Vibrio amylolyticus TaxID=2847292 RepID=A0A9X1XL29_9VIBR|nr:hypothetical protein [Vibrio amylolyticus]MCK6264917.1 hypothetical protein [Vibrio amylolyticus]